MSLTCESCGKGYQRGHSVSHAKNRHLRIFKPNLHFKTVEIDGKLVKRKLCTRCIKKLGKLVLPVVARG
ncbi:MAG TPA: 50S ribosomal protein L28 [Patescibacteria group bacterium]|nr:50S ribosomal protein L28 [Patescibacteria group bacterium]